ncbi:hypothetical protein ACOMHN_029047 [Nucella lapillus]
MNCGASCARLILIIFNFIFWLSGAAILGVGIWILVDPNLEDKIELVHTTDQEYFKQAAYLLLAFGAFIFLVGFSGCCGAIRNSKCLLGLYIFFLVVVFAGELAAGILAAIYKDEIKEDINKGLAQSIKDEYLKVPDSWDNVQKEFKCCGAEEAKDYTNSTWVQLTNRTDILIPESCCTTTNDVIDDKAKCQAMVSDYYTDGCKEKLMRWVDSHSIILIGVGCGIAALQIIGLVLAICLCRNLDDEKI